MKKQSAELSPPVPEGPTPLGLLLLVLEEPILLQSPKPALCVPTPLGSPPPVLQGPTSLGVTPPPPVLQAAEAETAGVTPPVLRWSGRLWWSPHA